MTNPTPKPTDEQQSIISAAKADGPSIIMNAYAGCAKTTTLELVAAATPQVPTLALAFNVRIKKELEARFPPNYQVKTLNGLGHAAWGKSIGRSLTLDDRKLGKLVTQAIKQADYPEEESTWSDLLTIVRGAMNMGLVPSHFPNKSLAEDCEATWIAIADDELITADPLLLRIARAVLIESVKLGFAGTISFDDQIYLSALYNGVFPRFARVLGDETQDFSPLNHIMLRKSAAGRLLLAGDRKQAIYAFRGADHNSMDNVKVLRSEWTELPLATTFRCPQVIVQRQQSHAPGFTAWHTNTAGQFINWAIKPGAGVPVHEWKWADVQYIADGLGLPNPSTVVMCRNNAPLLKLAFTLIRQGIGPIMLGRDLGKGLVGLAKKIVPVEATPIDRCIAAINEWQSNELIKAKGKGNSSKVAAINDRAECLLAVAESSGANTAKELTAALTALFDRQSGHVTLTSGHRSKGFEWDIGIHLDPWRIPSKHARRAAAAGDYRQMEQEQNLLYVIETRVKHILINASLQDFS